jgi:hypothetical protein
VADQARVGPEGRTRGAPASADRALGAAVAAESAGAAAAAASNGVLRAKTPAVVIGTTPPAECYRVESANGTAASWGTVPLPFVVMLAGSGGARIITADGKETDERATYVRGAGDSLMLRLRRIGYLGSLTLGVAGEARAGVMRSAPQQFALEEVVVTSTATADTQPTAKASAPRARRRAVASAPPPPADRVGSTIAPGPAPDPLTMAPSVPIVARAVRCIVP